MSGRRIDDHKDWIGGRKPGVPLPMESKMKEEKSADGAGHIGSSYPDTTEEIYRDQEAGIRHAEARKIKPGYRN